MYKFAISTLVCPLRVVSNRIQAISQNNQGLKISDTSKHPRNVFEHPRNLLRTTFPDGHTQTPCHITYMVYHMYIENPSI